MTSQFRFLKKNIFYCLFVSTLFQVIFFNDEYLRGTKDRVLEASEQMDSQAVKQALSQ